MLATLGASVATWAASQGAGLLLGFVMKLVMGYLDGQRAAQAQHDAGAAEVAAKVSKENSDVERRASEVAINARRGADLDDALASGARGI